MALTGQGFNFGSFGPPLGTWNGDYFDDSDWQGWTTDPYGTWSGAHWVAVEEPNVWLLKIEPLGGWEVGYRPSKMRLTLSTADDFLVRIRDTASNLVYSSFDVTWFTYQSGTEVTLDWSNNLNIDYLHISNEEGEPVYNLTAIEFLE